MTYQDAPDEIDDLFKLIIQSGHGIEINTSEYDTLGFFLPDYDIVRRYKELGGEIITIGSDSHKPEHLGTYIEESKALLKEMGFQKFCTYEKMKPVFHEL